MKKSQLVAIIAEQLKKLNEVSTGGLDPQVLFDFVKKYRTTFAGTDNSELQSVEGKQLFLDDLLTTQAGMDMLSGKLPYFAEALKKYNIKLNLTKANIEYPAYVAKIYDTLIKPGIIKLEDLKNTPNIVDKADAESANWSEESINSLKDQTHITAALILKATAKKVTEAEAPVAPTDVANLAKSQDSAKGVLARQKNINNITEFPGAFENWFSSLGFAPGKVSKSAVRSEVEKVLAKLGYK